MKVTTLVKRFQFIEDNRSRVTLGAGARIHPQKHVLQLDDGDTAVYPTDDDIRATTWITEPMGLVRWIGFECVGTFPTNDENENPTRALFRLSDGTTFYFWDDDADEWKPITQDIDGEWSTEEQVCEGIAVFAEQVETRKLQVAVNVKSDDADHTPLIREIKLAWECRAELQEDIILRSLVRELKEQLRPSADSTLDLASATNTFTVEDLGLETGYQVRSIDSVFNDTDDPDHMTDLLDSYDEDEEEATLTETVASGKTLYVRFLYEPVVAVTTSRDFNEVAALPSVSVQELEMSPGVERAVPDSVVNKATGAAIVVPAPIQGDLDFTLEFMTDKKVDHLRLAEELRRFFGNVPLLRSRMIDETFRLWLVEEYHMTTPTTGDARDLIRGELRARIVGALSFHRPASAAKAITEFVIRANTDEPDDEAEVTSIEALRVYWGTEVPAGPWNEAFVLALAESALGITNARVLDVTAELGEKIYVVVPVEFGTPTFEISGFEGGFFRRQASVTVAGVACDVWESDAVSLGATRVVVT